jgi:histidinol dehydrogenase
VLACREDEKDQAVEAAVEIIQAVRHEGDAAVLRYTSGFTDCMLKGLLI